MRLTLLGVVSFHRVCFSLRIFHEPACQTGERPHRAAFITSLSRWYIRRLLGNSPPFHPCLRRGGPVLSLTGLRHPTDYSPEIKARQALFAFLSVYPKEVALVGGATVQDYREIFLRGHGSQTSTHYGTVEYEDISLLYEERTFVALFLFVTNNSFLLTKRSIF